MGVLSSCLFLCHVHAAQLAFCISVSYGTGPLVLAGSVLVLLAFLFFLMLKYSNRVAQTGPMGEQVRAALSTVRQQQILKSLSEKWEAGGYHQEVVSEKTWLTENPIPPANTHVLENNPDIRSVRSRAVATGRVGTFLPAFGHEDPSIQSERSDYQAELRRWGDTVNDTAFQRYREEQQQELLKAGAETGNKIFDSFDFGSLWGQGPEFILQFTTVVTIIFAVFALSVLDQ
ncbi:MAG: hypothetical protein WA655_12945 [Candidatus Korobacteraceae bacterium]